MLVSGIRGGVQVQCEATEYNVRQLRQLVYVHYLNGIPVRWLNNKAS